MLDSHAHPGDRSYKNALVCSDSLNITLSEFEGYRYKSIGLLPSSSTRFNIENVYSALNNGFLIGEIGLDRRYKNIEKQSEIFKELLRVAKERDVLVTIHSVRTAELTYSIIKELRVRRFLIHSFSYSYEMAKRFLSLGGGISLSRRAASLKDFNKIITLPFLTETDMKTGREEWDELYSWNSFLSDLLGRDIAQESEKRLNELING